jgi:hypothetical protein
MIVWADWGGHEVESVDEGLLNRIFSQLLSSYVDVEPLSFLQHVKVPSAILFKITSSRSASTSLRRREYWALKK